MKLHLPKMLLTAVLAACCIMTTQALTVTEADGKTTISNEAGWSQEYTTADIYAPVSNNLYVPDFPAEQKSATILMDCGLGYDQVAYTNIGNAGDIIVGGSGQLFLQTWDRGAINLNNDIYLGSSTFGGEGARAVNAAMRLGEASGNIYLGGNVTLVEDSQIWMQGGDNTNTVTFAKGISGAGYKLTTVGMTRTTFGGTVTLKELDTRIQDGTQATQTSITLAGATDIETLNVNSSTVITLGETATTTEFDAINIQHDKSLEFAGQGKIQVNGMMRTPWTSDAYGGGTLIIGEKVEVTAAKFRNDSGITATINGTLTLEGTDGIQLVSGRENVINGTGTISTTVLGVGNTGTYIFRGGLRVEIGAGGIRQAVDSSYANETTIFEDVTVAATTSWTEAVTKALKLGSSTGTTFEIAKGSSVTLNGALSDKDGTQGKLVKTGAGELVLGAANTYSGGTSIQAGTLKVSGSGTLGSGPVEVQENGTLHIAGSNADTNGDWIISTTGTGDIIVSKNANLNAGDESKAKGNLKIQDATLNVNLGKNSSINLSTFTSWTLDKGIIYYHGANVQLNDLAVTSNGGEIQFEDMKGDYGACDTFTLAGTTTLNGKLSIKTKTWKSTTTIEKLEGSGNLEITGGPNGGTNKTEVNILGMNTYSGDITIAKNAGPAYLNISGTLNAGTADNATTITETNGAVINVGGGDTPTATSGNIEFASSINVLSTITNSGNLTLNGINVDTLNGFSTKPTGDTPTYSNGTDGFMALEYYIVKDSGGTLTTNNLSQYTFNGAVLDDSLGKYYAEDNSLILSLQGAGDYYVNTQVKAGGSEASVGTENATGYVINNGGKLTVDGALASSVVNGIRVADKAAAEITLLNQTMSHAQTVTMGDDATVSYILDNATLNLSNLGHVTNVTGLDLRNGSLVELHSTNSKLGTDVDKVQVKLSGNSAISLQNSASAGNDVWADIEIDGAGEIRGTTYGSDNTSVQGTITGSGTLSLKKDADGHANSFIVASTISDKEGGTGLKVVVDIDSGVTLSGKNTYTGGTEIKGGTLTTANTDALGGGGVTLNGGTLKLSEALTVNSLEYNSGSVVLNDKDLTVTNVLKVTDAALAITGSGSTTVGTLHLAAGGSISAEGSLAMTNLTLDSGSSINEALTLSNGTLTLTSGITLGGDLLTSVLGLQSETDSVTLLSGISSFVLDGTTYDQNTRAAFAAVDLATVFTAEGLAADTYLLSYSDGKVTITMGSTPAVPEPTTATLSLLALAGLAMRRRRK